MGKDAEETNDDKVYTEVQKHVHSLNRRRRRFDGDLVALGNGKVLCRFQRLKYIEGEVRIHIDLCEVQWCDTASIHEVPTNKRVSPSITHSVLLVLV